MVMNEFVPSPSICDSAMNLLMDFKDWDTALKVWKIMITNEIAGEEIGNSFIVCLCYNKRLPEACKYAEDMIDSGIKLQSSTLSKLRSSLQQTLLEGCGSRGLNIEINWMEDGRIVGSAEQKKLNRRAAGFSAGVGSMKRRSAGGSRKVGRCERFEGSSGCGDTTGKGLGIARRARRRAAWGCRAGMEEMAGCGDVAGSGLDCA
ncbi:hypothetical protein KSP40_PGU021409 [Platanthera guangdongensis]|uniref:Pentatricopeptide repeat-containing protein n=1 Tax=Platanthera guangdongensis TaxID=2320717 RepID=A0ABR2N255_9ASPA